MNSSHGPEAMVSLPEAKSDWLWPAYTFLQWCATSKDQLQPTHSLQLWRASSTDYYQPVLRETSSATHRLCVTL